MNRDQCAVGFLETGWLMEQREKIRGVIQHFAPIATMVCAAGFWGSATVLSKESLSAIPPVILLFIQLGASVLFLWIMAVISCARRDFDSALLRRGAIGILEPGLAYLFVLIGLKSTTASTATLIATMEPLMVVALSSLILGYKLNPWLFALGGLALAGVYLTLSPQEVANGSYGNFGYLYILLGTFFAALYVIFSPRALGDRSPLVVAAAQQSYGFLLVTACLVISPASIPEWGARPPYFEILLGAISGIVQYGLAFWCYLIALRKLDVRVAAMLLNLIPIFGLGTSYFFLNERLNLTQWLGGILIIFVICVASCIRPEQID